MPAIIRLVFVLGTFYCATALASLAELLMDDPPQHWLRRDVIVALATFVACGAIAYGASSARRYTRALTTVVLVAAPFAKPGFSWLRVIASVFAFVLALLFLYWDDEVADYFSKNRAQP